MKERMPVPQPISRTLSWEVGSWRSEYFCRMAVQACLLASCTRGRESQERASALKRELPLPAERRLETAETIVE